MASHVCEGVCGNDVRGVFDYVEVYVLTSVNFKR